jgi:CheY-like chemotaxis protein
MDLDGDLPLVDIDTAQIQQLIMNLVINGAEAIGDDRSGVVSVSTRLRNIDQAYISRNHFALDPVPPGSYVVIQVRDDGCGMDDSVRAHIFDPFFTTKFTGRGLGLAAVQGIIHRNGGAIRVASRAGHGSRFEVLLPCTSEPAGRAAAQPASSGQISGTCILVEDEEALRQAVSKMLRKRGFTVIEAGDGKAAVELLQDKGAEIDLVLLDLTLPGMSGREVFEALRRIRPDVKVVLTTAYSEETALTAIGGKRAWAYIQKPYQFNDLLALMRETASTHSRP